MNEILAKRLLILSRIHLFVFVFSLVLFVHKLDAQDLEKDARSLDLVTNVAKLDLRSAFTDGTIDIKARDWLQENDPVLAGKNTSVREQLVNELQSAGVTEANIGEVKGGNSEFDTRFSLIEIAVDPKLEPTSSYSINAQMVKEVLNRFDLLTRSSTMFVVTNVAIPQDFSTTLFADCELDRVFTLDEAVHINRRVNNNSLSQQSMCDSIQIPATVEQIFTLSIHDFLQGVDTGVDALRSDSDQLEHLRQLYGNMPVSLANQVVTEDLARAFRSITIFGFTFSTRRYPIAVMLFSSLTAMGIYWTIETAKRRGASLFDTPSTDIADLFLHNSFTRGFLWVVIPFISVYISLPPFALTNPEYAALVIGLILIVTFGLIALFRTRNTFVRGNVTK